MNHSLEPNDHRAIERIVKALENAWNAGDGPAFAAEMTEDADFVNVRAERLKGRAAIAAGHAAIFRTIYAGSRNQYTLEAVRLLTPDIALGHVRSALEVPTGPLAGQLAALFSIVLQRHADGWLIVAFHNTLVPAPLAFEAPRPKA